MEKEKYTIPDSDQFNLEEDTMVYSPSVFRSQYADDLLYGMKLLSEVDPHDLHSLVIIMSEFANKKKAHDDIRQEFDILFDKWWKNTCIFSGPNLCYDNEEFKMIKHLGNAVLPLIDEKQRTEPQYKQRHIQWLKNGIIA